MPSISVIDQSMLGRMLIEINWSDIPSVDFARVVRIEADGTEVVVRSHTFTSGDYIELSNGLAILYDTEMPGDENLTYRTEGLGSASTATSNTVVFDMASHPWLKSPLHPWADQSLLMVPTSYLDPSCIVGDSICFATMADEVRPSRTAVFSVNDARLPVPASRVRSSITSVLRLVTRTFTARDAVITLNESGDPLLFQAPSTYGIPDRYMTVGDYTVSRFSADHKKQWRGNTLPHVEVDSPAGLADGVLGVRWVDVCDVYTTFAAATAASLTWSQVMQGEASTNPSVDFCNYTQLAAAYASYNAMTAANVDYNALLDC